MISAPAAPMAPAWFTVATPAMIEPSTRKISASGGTRIRMVRPQKRALRSPSKGTAGASLGRRMAKPRMKAM